MGMNKRQWVKHSIFFGKVSLLTIQQHSKNENQKDAARQITASAAMKAKVAVISLQTHSKFQSEMNILVHQRTKRS